MTALLHVDGVSKCYGGVEVLRAVSLHVAEGTICGMAGPNGAGKTTLLNIISGLVPADSGSLLLSGRDYTREKPFRAARNGISRTFQAPRLIRSLTVEGNLQVANDTAGGRRTLLADVLPVLRFPRESGSEHVQQVVDQLDLGHFLRTPVDSLPYGVRRRVEIARALVLRPRLLLLDEPAAGMNGEEVDFLVGVLRNLADAGMTILVIEHNLPFLAGVCDEIVVLDFGQVIATGTYDEVFATRSVQRAYLGTEAE